MTLNLKIAPLFIAVLVLGACGGTQTVKKRGKFAPKLGADANAQKNIITESPPVEVPIDTSCKGATTTSLALVDFVAENIEGKTALMSGDKSLCDILTAAKTPVALFQVVKTDCDDCRDQIENVSLAIAASQYSEGISHIIVATNNPDAATLKEFETFSVTAAASATIIEDDASKAWNAFAADKTVFNSPTLIVLAMSSQGVIFNDNDDTYLDAIPAAEELIQAEVAAFDKTTPAGDIETTLDWDGLATLGSASLDIITIR